VYTCDVTDPLAVQTTVDRVTDDFGSIDALINNAGTIAIGPLEEMTREDYELAMNVNFWGPLNVATAVLPQMRQRGEGRIVNIGSIGGKIAMPHLTPYSASKFALVGLSEGMRAELAKDGVTVTTVCPGLMRTGSPRNVMVKGRHREEYAWFSISDSLPGLSMGAPRAARHIIAAMRRGDAELILSLPAKLAALTRGADPRRGTGADRAGGGAGEPRPAGAQRRRHAARARGGESIEVVAVEADAIGGSRGGAEQ
jgi:NAD(P)-dependent dehydrogenase (short-subunit alcohol dehydrogenase family)